MSFTRRFFLRTGAAAGAATLLGITNRRAAGKDDSDDDSDSDEDPSPDPGPGPSPPGTLFGYRPFTQPLFIPEVLTNLGVGGLNPTPAEIFSRSNFRGDINAGGARAPNGGGATLPPTASRRNSASCRAPVWIGI